MFTDVRADFPEWQRLSVQVGRGVLCRFDRTTRAFYKRCKEGGNPGYPRFKPRHRWRSIKIPDAAPSMLTPPNTEQGTARWWRLRVKGLPGLRFEDKNDRLAAALDGGGRVVELRVVRTALRTEIHAVVKHPNRPMAVATPVNPVGIDKGLNSRMVTSCGHADFRLAHALVSAHDGIASEDLNVAGMLHSKMFSRKMSQHRWSALDSVLEYKAWKAGVPYVRVSPNNTSTDCSTCGHRQAMPVSQRVYTCGACGMELCRDVNAARNIRARGFPTWKPRGREGNPNTTRLTNFCCKTTLDPGQMTQSDVAEQYA